MARYDYNEDEKRVEPGDRSGEDGSDELVEIGRDRAAYQSQARARLDKMATRIDVAKQKLQVLGAKAPSDVKPELDMATEQYDLIEQDVRRLDRTPPDQWERATEQLEMRESGLDARMSDVEDSIDDEE